MKLYTHPSFRDVDMAVLKIYPSDHSQLRLRVKWLSKDGNTDFGDETLTISREKWTEFAILEK